MMTQDLYKLKSTKFKDNLSKEERAALSDLQSDTKIEIKIADKGGNIVVWDKQAYIKEAYRQLQDMNYYEHVQINRTISIKKDLDQQLKTWTTMKLLNEEESI